jgi:hypothetical protein
MMLSGGIKIIDVRLPRSRRCGAFARRVLEAKLQTHVSPSGLANATLVVSELANNAYQHGEGEIRLMAWLLEDRIRFAINDEGRASVANIRVNPDESHSYGPEVVQRVSLEWGAREQPTLVWAEISRLPATELAGTRATDPVAAATTDLAGAGSTRLTILPTTGQKSNSVISKNLS